MSHHDEVVRYLEQRLTEHRAWRGKLMTAFGPFHTLVQERLGATVHVSDVKVTGNGLFLKLSYAFGDDEDSTELDLCVFVEKRSGLETFMCNWGTGRPEALNVQAAEQVAHRIAYLARQNIEYAYVVPYR